MTAAPANLLVPDAPASAPTAPAHATLPPRNRHPLAWLVPTAAVAIIATTGWCYLRPQGLEERRAAAFSPAPTASETPAPAPSAPAVRTPPAPTTPAPV